MASKAGVKWMALCDHDTAAGVEPLLEAVREYPDMQVLPGVEVSTGANGSVHVLGYGPAVLSKGMQSFLKNTGADRQRRAEAMLDRLADAGIAVPPSMRASLLDNPGVGRPHIGRALVELGVVSTVRQAFDRYLAQGQCAYVPRSLPSTAEAVSCMRELGAVPVLAHPVLLNLDWTALHALVLELKGCGLMGVEAYHPSANARKACMLDQLARSSGLLVTGGSDYHGDPGSTVHVGRLPAGWQSRSEDVCALLSATRM